MGVGMSGVAKQELAPSEGSAAQGRTVTTGLPRHPEFENFVVEANGYAWLPPGTFSGVAPAVEFAHRALGERREADPKAEQPSSPGLKSAAAWLLGKGQPEKRTQSESKHEPKPDEKREFRLDVLAPSTYEEAPPFFDLALSDDVLQIAIDYMGDVPILLKPRLWWTKPQRDAELKRTQLYHLGRRKGNQRRQAKFLFTMNDVDEGSGPFVFLPAVVSERITRAIPGGYTMGDRVADEEIYRHVDPSETLKLVGPPGTGLFVDTCRCFHYGARARDKERLMLM